MAGLKIVRKWFQQGTMCVGLDLKDAFLYVPMSACVKWKGKLYEWQVPPFGLECSPQILTFMVDFQTKQDTGVRLSFRSM